MEYGLIGGKLAHSFSKEIHTALAGYGYTLCEVSGGELEGFFQKRDFHGINVTIPYKKSVIKYLDCIDDAAAAIGAVNTVVNSNGKLYGYNTDAYGLKALIEKNGVSPEGKKVLILGSGGTSATAQYVSGLMGAGCVLRVSRAEKSGFITYTDAVNNHSDAEIIINTTPVGMFPDICKSPIDLSRFNRLNAVIDAVYNPLNSRLVLNAREMGVSATGGLYMLIMQAYMAARLFLNRDIGIKKAEKVYTSVLKQKRNIVLIGMPSAGKTSIGRLLSSTLDMPLLDSDEHITLLTGKTPADIIKSDGESAFREIERKVIRELSVKNHCIIATGGGAVTDKENILNLKANGKVYYINRSTDLLEFTADRPLSSSKQALLSLYEKRKDMYENAADFTVTNNSDLAGAADIIRKDFLL